MLKYDCVRGVQDIYIYEFQYLTIISPPVKLIVIVFIVFIFIFRLFYFSLRIFGGKLGIRIEPILRTLGVYTYSTNKNIYVLENVVCTGFFSIIIR